MIIVAFLGAYSLSVRDESPEKGPHVKHYKIRAMDDNRGYFITARAKHATLIALVEHYKGQFI